VSGPEREARRLARARPGIPVRKLAKQAGVRVELARRIIDELKAAREQIEATR
jgi:hypothetical protein